MRKSTFPKMYICSIPLDDGVGMSPEGVEPAVSSKKKSIQILDGIFENSVSKTDFQDILKFVHYSKSRQIPFYKAVYYQLLFNPVLWPAFLLIPKATPPKEEQDQLEKRSNLLSQDNVNPVVAQVAASKEKKLKARRICVEKRFLSS